MPGNAGLSFGFDVVKRAGSPLRLVIRLAPPGVRRQGNTDVLRQVPLLTALADEGIPIAPIVWSTDDERWFGTQALMQQRLESLPLHMTESTGAVPVIGGDIRPYLEQAVHALASIHAVDWKGRLERWEAPQIVNEQVNFWHTLLDKSGDAAVHDLGSTLADAILANDPRRHRVGLFHGDFQTNNVLYARNTGELEAVIDWEIAGIGPTGADVGWLSVMTDPSCWSQSRVDQMRFHLEASQIQRWYEDSSGRGFDDFDWYRAFACFRLGAIAAFNLRLHRQGQRVDAVNEMVGESTPVMFRRGLELLSAH
jgi:aminoglycoside phosphotransferase (APT) family kinase protein